MTFGIVGILIAYGCGVVSALGAFVWLNRNRADDLDKVEGKVRDIHKPF